MPLRLHRCAECGHEERSFKELPPYCKSCYTNKDVTIRMKRVIGSPQAKFMEKIDANKNKSNMKDQQKMLLERSRAHTRDSEAADELIQTNEVEIAKKNKWLVENSDGSLRKRKKIDDI